MNSPSQPPVNIIARTEGKRGEPLIIQWLAHLLHYPAYREVIVRFLCGEDFDFDSSDELRVEDETLSEEGEGKPDLRIEGDRTCLIVENKFGAPLTDKQPSGYIDSLKHKGQSCKGLVFLVPGWREAEIETLIRESKQKQVLVVVRTWEKLADKLAEIRESDLVQEFVREINRRCRVMSPLTGPEMASSMATLENFLRHAEFLNGLEAALSKSRLFAGNDIRIKVEKNPTIDNEELWFGINVENGEDYAWIGFWNLPNPIKTPLLGHVYDTASARKRFPKFWERLDGYKSKKVVLSKHDNFGWPVPIPVGRVLGNSINKQAEAAAEFFCDVLDGKL